MISYGFYIVQELLENTRGQYANMERTHQEQIDNVEKKYVKAKKVIKEYQTRYANISTVCSI